MHKKQKLTTEIIETPIISVYNYKGGVGKTTIAMNLATSLSTLGKKVLMVDADCQSSLTSFFISDDKLHDPKLYETHKQDTKSEANSVLSDKTSSGKKFDINRVMDSPSIYIALLPDMLGAITNENTYNVIEVGSKISKELSQKLYLLPGDPRLIEFEMELSYSETLHSGLRYLGAFRRLLKTISFKHKFDYVIVDLSPSSGILNKVFCMSSDYILPPSFPDCHSAASVNLLLNTVLPSWYKWQQDVIQRQKQTHGGQETMSDYMFNTNVPKILPIIVTNYQVEELSYPDRDKCELGNSLTITPNHSIWINTLDSIMSENTEMSNLPVKHFGDMKFVIPLCSNMDHKLSISQKEKLPLVCYNPNKETDSIDQVIEYAKKRYESLAMNIMVFCNT